MSTMVAPAASSAANASLRRAITSGSAPAGRSVTRPMRIPVTPCETDATSAGAGCGIDVESITSWPAIASVISAASATVVANGPT